MKKVKYFILITLLVVLTINLCSCKKEFSSEDICSRYISAVVEIQVRDTENNIIGNATGTFISPDGEILTNRHVIRSYDYTTKDYIYYNNIYIRQYNESEYTRAELIKYSNECDLALLKIERQNKNYFRIEPENTLKYGEVIHTIGNGNGYGLAYSQGNISAPVRNVQYEDTTIEAIQLSLLINEGNSGGPLINSNGYLVGITTFRLRDKQNNVIYGTSFALPIKTINSFLESVK